MGGVMVKETTGKPLSFSLSPIYPPLREGTQRRVCTINLSITFKTIWEDVKILSNPSVPNQSL